MNEYVTFLHEVFRKFGEIKTRKMFGGYGVYHQGVMFALVADDELYLKVDQETVDQFLASSLYAFEYHKNGKRFKMSYHKAPDEVYDDPDIAQYWANLGFEAALRSAAKK